MTLEEKVAQIVCIWSSKKAILSADGSFDPAKAELAIPMGIGGIARPSDTRGHDTNSIPNRTARDTVGLINALQRWLLEQTRLGIPALLHEEALHGYRARGATHFPQAIALAATWDPQLVEEVYSWVAQEVRVRGVHQVLAPVVDIARDPRWGRTEETFGEDPHLTAEMGIAAVRGFQGRQRLGGTTLLPRDKVLVTLKHMTGHGQPESGTNVGPAQISERVLREVFLQPFERVISEAGALAVMASYNEIDGVPSHVNAWLLTEVLRDEWGFEGVVVADYFAVKELMYRHRVVSSLTDGALQALQAGVDIELPDPEAFPALIELARKDRQVEQLIDRAVTRSLRIRFLAGVFEHPFGDANRAEELTGNHEARRLALRAAEKAVTLLKNDGGLLPLDLAQLSSIAVIGPNADETILGGYSAIPRHTVSILDGIRSLVGDRAEVRFAKGVLITPTRDPQLREIELADEDENRRLIAQAAAIAAHADVAIVAVGGNELTCREAWAESHLGDRADLELVGQQNDLVKAVVATGTPTVVVLIHGRPLAVNDIAETVPAILDGWYLGQETGTAVARVLFGEVNPGGKLPVTIPRSVGQLPLFYNHKPTARRGYLFSSTEPLWPFGFGMSYTSFSLNDLRLSAAQIKATESTQVSVVVENTGSCTGDEVVQLYIRDSFSSVTRPVKELKVFKRVTLDPGEEQKVSFTVGPKQLRFYDRLMNRVVEPGEFEIMVGTSSDRLGSLTLTVLDDQSD
jgi:beta-glucosidase